MNDAVSRGKLLRFVALHLGTGFSGVTAMDAEDVWARFCSDRVDKLMRDYNPSIGPFEPFVLLALKQTCWREAKRLRGRVERLRLASVGDPPPVLGATTTAKDPETLIGEKGDQRRLRHCVSALAPDDRLAIVSFYFDEKPLKEIAMTLGVSEGAVKVRLHRIRHKLKVCLTAPACNRSLAG